MCLGTTALSLAEMKGLVPLAETVRVLPELSRAERFSFKVAQNSIQILGRKSGKVVVKWARD